MHSWQIIDWGAPLEARDFDTPEPTGSEVLLQVDACGLCHSDLHIWDGFFDLGEGKRIVLAERGVKLPFTMGHEVAGEVVALGPEAEGVALGDKRVVFPWIGCRECEVCLRGDENLCLRPQFVGARVDGGYADHVLVPHAKYLIDYEGLPVELACTYACSGITAFGALKKVTPLGKDDPLVIVGAGGVGMNAVHLAQAMVGGPVIVADIDATKRAAARQAGAEETIDNGAEGAVKRVLKMTQGGAAAAIDFVGAPASAGFGMDVLRKGGTLIVVGLYGGALPVPLPLLPQKALTLRGSYVGTLEQMGELMALVKGGKVAPLPLENRPLAEVNTALDDLKAGRVLGRIVLKP